MRIPFFGKVIIGIFTIGQLFLGLAFVIWFFAEAMPVLLGSGPEEIKNHMAVSMPFAFLWGILMSVLSMVLILFYVLHAGMHRSMTTVMKVVWIVLFLFLGGFAQLVYFFMEIAPAESMTARLHEAA